jgi:2-succinyl-5-enolpyruvyl-6-hydroxy-3-cyclohexene-1-carboxylate synthase
MYTSIKNVQVLIALLKKYNIKHFVISPGARMRGFVHSIENDTFFQCYSVVDERNAAFFAMGISQELNVPVGIVCTSSTACCNYLSGITEAFYQNIPLVVLTGDRDPYLFGQMEDLMIKQVDMYHDVIKKGVNLPIIKDSDDFYYCERLINEALLELDHRGKGPVHINVPIVNPSPSLNTQSLPEVKAISRIFLDDDSNLLKDKVKELQESKKILIIAGGGGGGGGLAI